MDVRRFPDNRTPLAVRCTVIDDPAGFEQVVTIAKLTWQVGADGGVALAIPPAPPRLIAPLRDGAGTSLRAPDDGVQHRPGTDVVMVGTAHPPPSRAVKQVDVVLRVRAGEQTRLEKLVRVYGPRVWEEKLTGIAPGPPQTLTPTPLIFENAYGGADRNDATGEVAFERRNPVGRGVALDRRRKVGQPAPVLEDPDQPLDGKAPAPACFAPIPPHWMPLAGFGGTYDEAWRTERNPLKPVDFDPRHDGCAPEGQHLEEPLQGDETYELVGVRPDGAPWVFTLPLYRPHFVAKRRDEEGERALSTHLDTVFIHADEERVELTWRACVPLPRVPQLLEYIRIGSRDELPDAVRGQVVAEGRATVEVQT